MRKRFRYTRADSTNSRRAFPLGPAQFRHGRQLTTERKTKIRTVLPKTAVSLTRAIRSLQPLAERRGSAELTTTLLSIWQKSQFPGLVRRAPRADPRLARDSDVLSFAARLGTQSFADAAFWLSCAYASWLGSDARAERALFFTPPRLATRLLRDLVTNGASLCDDVWVDPACGGAAFLAPVARRMADALRRDGRSAVQVLKHVSSHLVGNDVDPVLCGLSRQFLRMALYPEIRVAQVEPRFVVTCRDALGGLPARTARPSVVICNPPYRKLSADEVHRYGKRYGQIIEGQSNIYSLFFKLSLDLVKTSGIVGLITPTSFLSGRNFSQLRTYLLKRAANVQLDIVRDREGVFVGVNKKRRFRFSAAGQPGQRRQRPRSSCSAPLDNSPRSGNVPFQILVKCGPYHVPRRMPRCSGRRQCRRLDLSTTAM